MGWDELVPAGRLLRKGVAMELLIAAKTCGGGATTILWIIAAICVIGGIVTLVRGAILSGIALIIVGLLIGPGRREHLL